MTAEILSWDHNERLDAALKYARIGWHILPIWWVTGEGECACGTAGCKNAGKHPLNRLVRHGKDNATTDEETLRSWWKQYPDANLAVDAEKSGLVIVDIDPRNGGLTTKELLEDRYGPFSSEVLAYSGGGGEHWVYQRPEVVNLPGKLGPGIDLKLNGYILVEPSNHISGREYVWEASSSPIEGEIPSPLPDWIRSLSVISEREHTTAQEQGCRYADPQTIEDLRSALAFLPADDRGKWVDYANALCALGQVGFDLWDEHSQKSDKYDPVDGIRVWRSCKPGSYNYESIFLDAQEAGWVNPQSGDAPPEPEPEPIVTYSPPPVETIEPGVVPGALGDFVQFYRDSAVVDQPMLAIQAALALGSVACGRHYKTDRRTNYSNLWFMNVAKSGAGKEHAKWCIEQVVVGAGYSEMLADGYTSRSGVFSKLDTAPAHICVIDELGRHLQASRDQHSTHLRDAITILLESFNRSNGTLRPLQFADRGLKQEIKQQLSQPIVNPCITILGMTTPNTLFDAIDVASVRDGFLARFIMVESAVEDGGLLTEEQASQPPESLVDWFRAAVSHSEAQGNLAEANPATTSPTTHTVHIDDDAWAVFQEHKQYEAKLRTALDETNLAELANRSTQKAMRVALVLSVSVNPYTPTITSDLAKWACSYVSQCDEQMIATVQSNMSSGRLGRLMNQVSQYVAKGGQKGRTEREIKRCFGAHGRDLNDCLRVLVDSGLARFGEISSQSGRGRKRKAYVHERFTVENDQTSDSSISSISSVIRQCPTDEYNPHGCHDF